MSPTAARLLAWYDRARRDLPWRALPGEPVDPYRVWLSEVMLQQTTVATVKPYYAAFLLRFPSLAALAAAPLDDVLHAWQGLGYYSRARNLHACARRLVATYQGRFPPDEVALRALPGIGEYTAAAIAAIAFELPAVAVDGNVLRVLARLSAEATPLPGARAVLADRARALVPAARRGDFAQALMELGATVCTPRRLRCDACPWRETCRAHAAGQPERWPRRLSRPEKPLRHGVAFVACRGDGAWLLRRRPPHGLLGGLMAFPTTSFRDDPWALTEALAYAPQGEDWTALAAAVRHTFTHFHLQLVVAVGRARPGGATAEDDVWLPPDRLSELALPTLMKKVHALVRSEEGAPALPGALPHGLASVATGRRRRAR